MGTKLYAIAICLLLFGANCKKKYIKYEEDPEQSSSSPKTRLLGLWLMDQYTFNGNDIKPNLNKIFSNRFDISAMRLQYGYDNDSKEYFFSVSGSTKIPFTLLDQEFDEKLVGFNQNFVSLQSPAGDSAMRMWLVTPFHFTSTTTQNWRVTKLFDKSFNIVLDTDSGQFKMFLLKK